VNKVSVTVLQVLFGLALFAWIGAFLVNSNLLFIWEAHYPDALNPPTWRSGIVVVILIAFGQWISYRTFRRRIALQVALGFVLCSAIAAWLVYSRFSFFWEVPESDGSVSITWRSDVMLFFTLSVAQGISFSVFRLIRLRKRNRLNEGIRSADKHLE
jgi:hypothetical protein